MITMNPPTALTPCFVNNIKKPLISYLHGISRSVHAAFGREADTCCSRHASQLALMQLSFTNIH